MTEQRRNQESKDIDRGQAREMGERENMSERERKTGN